MGTKKISSEAFLIAVLVISVIILGVAFFDQGIKIKGLKAENQQLSEIIADNCETLRSFKTQCNVEDSNITVEITYPENVMPEKALDMRVYF